MQQEIQHFSQNIAPAGMSRKLASSKDKKKKKTIGGESGFQNECEDFMEEIFE